MRGAVLGMLAWLLLSVFAAGAADAALLRGRVADIDGRPVAGAKLFVYDSANVRRPATFISPPSAADGTVAITVPPGTYWVVARFKQDESYGPLMPGDKHSGEPAVMDLTTEAELEQDFTVADIRELGRKRQTIAADSLRLKGRVLDAEGNPVAGAYVFASTIKGGTRIPDYVSAWTGADGTYMLALPSGPKYFLGVATAFPPMQLWRTSAEVVPVDGKTDIVLDMALALD